MINNASRCRLFVFFFVLACPCVISAAEIPCVWTGVEKVVAVGDIHGDYENFLLLVKQTNLVSDDLHWTGGNTHLVQIGDIMDRGTGAKEVMDLLMRLEKEAKAAGGMVHVLLGNHEELNITGRALDYPDYIPVEQFLAFLPEDFRKSKEKEYLADAPGKSLDLSSNEDLRRYWQNLIKKDAKARKAYITNFNKTYGKWLLQKNAVIKINDVVFSHAGISDKYATWDLRDINDTLRSELRLFAQYADDPYQLGELPKPTILYDQLGPLWYRGLATRDEAVTEKEIIRTLNDLNAKVMVTGHNFFQNSKNNPALGLQNVRHYNGRVYNIDTGINRLYRGLVAALIIDNGNFALHILDSGQRIAKESSPAERQAAASRQEIERFLKNAAVAKIDKSSDVSGRTAPWKVTLAEAGITRQAVFKYIDHRRPDPLPGSYKYEVAAYELAKYLGLEFVPSVVEREIDGLAGSLQVFVENSISEWERKERKLQPADAKAFTQEMANLRIFQNLVLDSCENVQDILINRNTWKVYQVDFSEAFAPNNTTFRECEISRCSRKLYQKLLEWNEGGVRSSLAPYLNDEEIRALNARKDLILSTIKGLIGTKGDSAVLY